MQQCCDIKHVGLLHYFLFISHLQYARCGRVHWWFQIWRVCPPTWKWTTVDYAHVAVDKVSLDLIDKEIALPVSLSECWNVKEHGAVTRREKEAKTPQPKTYRPAMAEDSWKCYNVARK